MSAAKRLADQTCKLRELVLAHHAFNRAAAEFYIAIGNTVDDDEKEAQIEAGTRDWLDTSAPDDGRDVTEEHLHHLFCFIPTDGK